MVAEEFKSIMGWTGGVAEARKRQEVEEQGLPSADPAQAQKSVVVTAVQKLESVTDSEREIDFHTHVIETRGPLAVEEDKAVASTDAQLPQRLTGTDVPVVFSDIYVEDLDRERTTTTQVQQESLEDMPASHQQGPGQQRAGSKEEKFVPALTEKEGKLDVQGTQEAASVRRSVHGWGQTTLGNEVHSQKHNDNGHPAHGPKHEEAHGTQDTLGKDAHMLEYSADAKEVYAEEHRHQHGDVANPKKAAARQQQHHKNSNNRNAPQPSTRHAVENIDAQIWMEHTTASHAHKNIPSAPLIPQAGQAGNHKKCDATQFDESHLPHFSAERAQRGTYRTADGPHLEGHLIALDTSESAMHEKKAAAGQLMVGPQKDLNSKKVEARTVKKLDRGDNHGSHHVKETKAVRMSPGFAAEVRGQALVASPEGGTLQSQHRDVKLERKAGNNGPRHGPPSSGWEGDGSGQSVVPAEGAHGHQERSPSGQRNQMPKRYQNKGVTFSEYVDEKHKGRCK